MFVCPKMPPVKRQTKSRMRRKGAYPAVKSKHAQIPLFLMFINAINEDSAIKQKHHDDPSPDFRRSDQ
jgi:hypothetical protein